MSALPEGSTGILFLSRGKNPGHFVNVVKKAGEVQYWCGQLGQRIRDPIQRFSLGGKWNISEVDLMITSQGGGPVLKRSLPRG
jgi:hypothetical protein